MINMGIYMDIARWVADIDYPWWCKGAFLRGKYFSHQLRKQRKVFREDWGFED